MIKYKIGTEFLDQFDNNSSFAITKAVSKIGEINLRHGDRSTGFKVPLTAKNTKLLNYVTIINSSTSNQSFQRIQGKLVEDDVVISDGYFQVTKFNPYKKEVDMRFYGGNTDWFSELKDRKINESYTDYQPDSFLGQFGAFINDSTIKSNLSQDLDEDTPYKYFLVDNNADSFRNTSNATVLNTTLEDWQLGFSQGFIFNQIIQSLGITTKGNMFEDPLFFNTLICKPKNLKEYIKQGNETTYNYTLADNTVIPFYTPATPALTKSNLGFSVGPLIEEYNGTLIELTGGSASNVNVKFQLTIGRPVGGTIQNVYADIYISSAPISPAVTDYPLTELSTNVYELNYNFNVLNQNDTIEFRFGLDITGVSPSGITVRKEDSNMSFRFDQYVAKSKALEVLPDLTQSEFIKDVLFQFGAVSQYDVKTKTLTCNKFDIIDDNKRNAIDWSSRIDLGVLPTVELTKILSNYAKKSFFEYLENDEADILNNSYTKIYNNRLGKGVLEIDNGFLTDEKNVYESPYTPTIQTATFPSLDLNEAGNQLGNFFLPFVPIKTLTGSEDDGSGGLNPVFTDNSLNPRKFLYLGNINVFSSYKGNCNEINIGTETGITELPLVYFDKERYEQSDINNYTETLSFGSIEDINTTINNTSTAGVNQYLIPKYYSFQKSVLNKPIYLEINLMLTSLDVQNVDFFTPIFLNFGLDSGYYYIDEISQYKGQDKSTKVKLVKI